MDRWDSHKSRKVRWQMIPRPLVRMAMVRIAEMAGWKLMDSVSLDYNRDGRPDYVGMLDNEGSDIPPGTPRILFALDSSESGGHYLDFQD